MNIPRVSSCDMEDCFFNKGQTCHAPAINVGGDHPLCDTFINNSRHGGDMDRAAMVGACKVSNCTHNTELCCGAPTIRVGPHRSHGDCQTFEAR